MIKYLALLLLLPVSVAAQNDTVYLDKRAEKTTKVNAAFFRPPLVKEGNVFKVQEFYMSGQLHMEGYYSSVDPNVKEGFTTYYYENGARHRYGNYMNNKETGIWTVNYKNAENVHLSINYNAGKDTSQSLNSFYKSGKLKRKQWTRKGKTHGKCYTEEGTEIPFTQFESMPEPGYNLNKFLMKNLKYPTEARRAKIEGRVIVNFVLMEDGKVDSVKIEKSVHPALDNEAIRVVSKMPPWSPGIQDDERVKVYFTFPIMFKLP